MPCPASSTLALAHAFAGRQASRQAVAIADWHMQTGTCRLAHADWHKQTSKTVVSTWMRTAGTRTTRARITR